MIRLLTTLCFFMVASSQGAMAEMNGLASMRPLLYCRIPAWGRTQNYFVDRIQFDYLQQGWDRSALGGRTQGQFNPREGYTPMTLTQGENGEYIFASTQTMGYDRFTFNLRDEEQNIHVTQNYDGASYDYDMICSLAR